MRRRIHACHMRRRIHACHGKDGNEISRSSRDLKIVKAQRALAG
jgi:hypothetical protein